MKSKYIITTAFPLSIKSDIIQSTQGSSIFKSVLHFIRPCIYLHIFSEPFLENIAEVLQTTETMNPLVVSIIFSLPPLKVLHFQFSDNTIPFST